jgi:hypothetical protein
VNKLLSSTLLLTILIGSFALVGTARFCTVKAATSVTGIITSDTTWTKINSPYNLTGPILVNNGVTLTIEAGATVNLNSYYIRVAGTLHAQGSSADKIYFNGGSNIPNYSIDFTESSTSWNERTGSGCIIENAVINSIHTGIFIENVAPKINNNYINAFYAIDVSQASPVISNNIINGAIGVHTASPTITGNTITGRIEIGERYGGMTVISNNKVIGGGLDVNSFGIVCGDAYIYGNVIYGFTVAGIVTSDNATIEKNLIMYNPTGIKIDSRYYWVIANPTIRYNTITNNSVGIEMNIAENIDATNNWWGTTDTQAIEQSIHDFEDDFNLGKVTFVPFLTAPNPEAPEIPTPTPSPIPSPEPTPTPSQGPQQTQQFEAIVGAAIVVTVLGAGLGLLIYLIRRK